MTKGYVMGKENHIYNRIIEDVMSHMKLLNIDINKSSLNQVLTCIPSDVEQLYIENNRDGYYQLYKIIEIIYGKEDEFGY